MTDAVVTLLGELGGSPDEIAQSFVRHGICARKGNTCFDNPIVRFINRQMDVGGRMHIALGSDLLTIARDGSWHTVRLPEPVCSFLARFHAGEFPQIEQQ
jgi:hypothetical protein